MTERSSLSASERALDRLRELIANDGELPLDIKDAIIADLQSIDNVNFNGLDQMIGKEDNDA